MLREDAIQPQIHVDGPVPVNTSHQPAQATHLEQRGQMGQGSTGSRQWFAADLHSLSSNSPIRVSLQTPLSSASTQAHGPPEWRDGTRSLALPPSSSYHPPPPGQPPPLSGQLQTQEGFEPSQPLLSPILLPPPSTVIVGNQSCKQTYFFKIYSGPN